MLADIYGFFTESFDTIDLQHTQHCSKSFQRKAENLITPPIMEPPCKAFSDEIARVNACQLWPMSDIAQYQS